MLMRLQVNHFREMNGRALFLCTEYGGVAFKMYKQFGYHEINSGNKHMALYVTHTKETFENEYFPPSSSCVVESLSWAHYPASAALFLREQPEVIRCSLLRTYGQSFPEQWMLTPLLQQNKKLRCAVLKNHVNSVVGFSSCGPHPIWKGIYILDVFCHTLFWDKAEDLVKFNLKATGKNRFVAYVDVHEGCKGKQLLLTNLGFMVSTQLKDRVIVDKKGKQFRDVVVFERLQEN